MGGLLNILFDFQVKTSKQLAKILAFSLTVSAGLHLEILLCVTINHSRWNCRWSRVVAAATAPSTIRGTTVYSVLHSFMITLYVVTFLTTMLMLLVVGELLSVLEGL